MKLVVDGRLTLVHGGTLSQRTIDVLYGAFTHQNPDYWKFKRLGFRGKPPEKQIFTARQGKEQMSFPRGGLVRLRELLQEHRIATEITDCRSRGDPSLAGKIPPHQKQLWPFQIELEKIARLQQTALIRSPAGSGKSTIGFALIAAINLPAVVVVSNGLLLQQWIKRAGTELGLAPAQVGVIQGSKKKVQPLTIAMQQTLVNCPELGRAFGVVLVDEVQRAAADTLFEVVDALPAKWRIGVSDDERRSDGKEFLIRDLFGELAGEAKHEDLVRDGFIVDVEVRVMTTGFDLGWYHSLDSEHQPLAMGKVLDEMFVDDARNKIVEDLVAVEVREQNQVLVMTDRREHVVTLDRLVGARGVRSGFVLGGAADKHESESTASRLVSGELQAAIGTYQAIGTGIDLPKISRGIFATPKANSEKGRSQWKQYRGRFARSADGKGTAAIFYLWDEKLFGSKPLRHICRWNKSVTVWWHGAWRPGKEVLKEFEHAEEK